MHVAGTVAGNTQGWARDSNIYYISPYSGTQMKLQINIFWVYFSVA